MNKRKTLITMLALVCMLVVGIGFAAITKTLQIQGSIVVDPNTAGFVVEFEDGTGYTVDSSDSTKATIAIAASNEFIAPNATKTVTLTIGNNSSENYAAKLQDIEITNNNATQIEVTTNFDTIKATNIAKGSDASLVVTIKLLKAQSTQTTYNFTITFDAEAVQA